jgi:dGTPase
VRMYDAPDDVSGDWCREAQIPPPPASMGAETYRHPVRRDSARVLHSPAFRRLCGKTQLFPVEESDFFRNRLTHSLEVGQIARSIAVRLNATAPELADPDMALNCDLVELAGWCHDIGHPPFGHTGEAELDERSAYAGGFEGNAQTLRLLARLEKGELAEGSTSHCGVHAGRDFRVGLNLTYRTLASTLKYDAMIPTARTASSEVAGRPKIQKGYYTYERELVGRIRNALAPDTESTIRTIECSIMDVADDIAYSTYDMEDAFKGGFLQPLDLLAAPDDFLQEVAAEVQERAVSAGKSDTFDVANLREVLSKVVREIMVEAEDDPAAVARSSKKLAEDGRLRRRFTSHLIGSFIRAVGLKPSGAIPKLWSVDLEREAWLTIEALKVYTFKWIIMSPEMRVVAHRGRRIVGRLYEALVDPDQRSDLLLPQDVKDVWKQVSDAERPRVAIDFIAGMTDRYAVEYYGRMYSRTTSSVFKRLG